MILDLYRSILGTGYELIPIVETFIAGINYVDNVMCEWNGFVAQPREKDLVELIHDQKLKPEEARVFYEDLWVRNSNDGK